MKLRNILIPILLVPSLLTIGCGDDSPSFSLLSDSDTFFQDDSNSVAASKVDILWVVDNSGSMQTSQDNLAANFQNFIADFQGKGYDFQMAVTTTEAYKTVFSGNDQDSRFRDGVGSTHSGHFILDALTPGLTDAFITNVSQGTHGDGDERAFSSISATLDNPLNAGFLREKSFLSVIIVSDEDDFSYDSANFPTQGYNTPGLHASSDYVDYLDQLTGSTSAFRKYSVSAMAIFDDPCYTQLTAGGWTGRKIGTRYAELVDATGGVKGSLCEDFATTLEEISANILQGASSFLLSRIPKPETIVIRVDSVVVPEASSNGGNGWIYDSSSNSIIFTQSHIPPAGAAIQVDFDPVEYGS